MQFENKKGKALGVFSLAMINIIAIDSLRNLPINASYGAQIVFLYILGAICFLIPCCFMTAMLSTRFPKTGGTYLWVEKAFGKRWGFLTIWLLWIYNVVWFPTILSFIAVNIAYLTSPHLAHNKFFIVSIVIGVFFLATLINNLGVRTASWLSTFGAVIGTLIPMILIILFGFIWILNGQKLAIHLDIHQLIPNISHIKDLSFIIVIIFSLIGIEMSAVHAGDVKNPRKDFPRALFLSAILIIVSNIFSALSIAIAVPKSQLGLLSGLDQALSIFLNSHGLHWLFMVIILMVLLGSFAGMSAWTLGPARGMSVAAQSQSAPKWFAKVNKYSAPSRMLWAQWMVVCILASLFLCFKQISDFYGTLSVLTGQLALIYYILFFAAGLYLGLKLPKDNLAYTIPGKKWGIWISGLLGLVTCVTVIILGFIPPTGIQGIHAFSYELVLICGIILFVLIPWFLNKFQ